MASRISPARGAAFNVLLRVETRDSYAAELLHSNLLQPLSAADRSLATELVMGVLRWQQKLDAALETAAGKSMAKFDVEVKLALRLGAYQILFLDRIPARAAVNESVELVKLRGKRSAAPLVNAVLRKLVRGLEEQKQSTRSTAELANTNSHPAWLVERWAKSYGIDATRSICEFDQRRPKTTIRLYAREGSGAAASRMNLVREELAREQITLEPAPIVANAWNVTAGDITRTIAYRERRVSVQDEGSQLVALLAQGNRILDCCAAPGGKSAVVMERNPEALVVSMDLHLHRVRLTRELISSRTVLAADALHPPFVEPFDCVIADLSCTGTGTLGRNPEIKWRLTPGDVPRLANLQLEILRSVAPLARRIVYSTCSLEPEEGEQIVASFLSMHPEFRAAPVRDRLQELAEAGAVRSEAIDGLVREHFLRTIPGVHLCDGFFGAILET